MDKRRVYQRFTHWLKTNVDHSRYLYAAVKPADSDNNLYVASDSQENCEWLREHVGYFFEGTEIRYYVVNADGTEGA